MTDGTEAGTTLVKNIDSVHGPLDLTGAGRTLFFTADVGVEGQELWTTDGTKAGTTLVKDIDPGANESA
jgi:ELWxxDGT repeat protein